MGKRKVKAMTDPSGRESIRFYKYLSNGYVVVVEKEYKNSPNDMETITMWAELSEKATNAQRNAAPDTHVQNAILDIDVAKIKRKTYFSKIGYFPALCSTLLLLPHSYRLYKITFNTRLLKHEKRWVGNPAHPL